MKRSRGKESDDTKNPATKGLQHMETTSLPDPQEDMAP